MKPLTDRWLKKTYDSINRDCFDGCLARPAVLRFAKLGNHDEGVCRFFDDGTIHIYIDRFLQKHPNLAEMILIHEMAHQRLGSAYTRSGGHGMRFQAELVRLFETGAYDELL
jgi:hypothetical protein